MQTDDTVACAVQQAERLRAFFPKLDVSHVERLASALTVPENYRLIVTPKFVSVKSPLNVHKSWHPFNRSMERLLGIMREVNPDFIDWIEGNVGPSRLRLHEKTKKALITLASSSPGDVLVFPAQTGNLHSGWNSRRFRRDMSPNEFGLDPFSVGIVILLHHPDWPNQCPLFRIDCAGAEYTHVGDGRFAWQKVLVWNLIIGDRLKLDFDLNYNTDADAFRSGPASGFLT